MISLGARYRLAGNIAALSTEPILLPVAISSVSIDSISSPKKLMRYPKSA
jgi:hypothetical protein